MIEASGEGLTVDFAKSVQELGPLQEAAYRLLGTATCHITEAGSSYRCNLIPRPDKEVTSLEALRVRFLDLVTDENLRQRISRETDGVRNVILALAFGALARTRDGEQGL